MTAQTVLMWRIGGGLYAADHRACDFIDRIAEGEEVAVRLMKGRAVPRNAFYWRVLDRIVKTIGPWKDAYDLHDALKVAAGHTKAVQLLDGRHIRVPDSVSFDRMSQQDAAAYYDAAFRLISQEILAGKDVEAFMEETAA